MGKDSGNIYPGNKAMTELKTVFKIFCECWQLYRKYAVKELTEKEVEKFIEESSEISLKYHTAIAKDMILTVINEVERIEKKKHGKTE